MILAAALLLLSCPPVRAAAASGSGPPALSSGTAAPAEPQSLIQDSKDLLAVDKLKAALADADAAVKAGGGADALAARAEAELALGMPLADAVADYAAAAKLDPRYGEKYRGLLAQMQSEEHPGKSKSPGTTGAGGVAMSFVGGLVVAGLLLLAAAMFLLRRKKNPGKSGSEL